MVIKVGVLELQGDFALHHLILQKIGVQPIKVKKRLHLDGIDGLVIPGGESTTMSNLIETFKLREDLIDFSSSFPIMGTCAGAILMSNKVIDDDRINPLRLVDFSIERNSMIISQDVVYTDAVNTLKTDVIEINIDTKDTKFFMYDKNNKVSLKRKN